MPITIQDVDGGRGVLIRGEGVVEREQFLAAFQKHLCEDQEALSRVVFSLSDYTAVTALDVLGRDVDQIAVWIRDAAPVLRDPVIAFAAPQDLVFGLARMWEIMTDQMDLPVRVFRSRREAEDWISLEALRRHGIDDIRFG